MKIIKKIVNFVTVKMHKFFDFQMDYDTIYKVRIF